MKKEVYLKRIQEMSDKSYEIQNKRNVLYILKEEEIKQYQQTLNELSQAQKHILSLINKDILRLVFLLALSGWIIFASASIIISIIIILMSIVAAAPVSKDIIELNKTYKEFKADEKEIAANKEILENEMCSWHDQTLKMVEKIEKEIIYYQNLIKEDSRIENTTNKIKKKVLKR